MDETQAASRNPKMRLCMNKEHAQMFDSHEGMLSVRLLDGRVGRLCGVCEKQYLQRRDSVEFMSDQDILDLSRTDEKGGVQIPTDDEE